MPDLPPVPDGLADRLRVAVNTAICKRYDLADEFLGEIVDTAVDAVLADPAVAAALASPPAAEAVQRERQAVSAYLNRRAGNATDETFAASLRGIARMVEEGHVATRPTMHVAVSPPAVPTGEPERERATEWIIHVSAFGLPDDGTGTRLFAAVADAVESVWPRSDVSGGLSGPDCHGVDPGPQPAPSPSGETAEPSIHDLIERSSLGEPDAVAARATVSDEQVAEVMRRVKALGSGETAERAKALLHERRHAGGPCPWGLVYRARCFEWAWVEPAVNALEAAGLLSSPAQTAKPPTPAR